MAMNGTDVLLYANTGTDLAPVWTVVGSQRNLSRDESTESIDVSSKASRAKRVLPGRYASSMSLEALYVPDDASYLALKSAMRDGDLIKVRISEVGIYTEEADAVITSMSEEFPDQAESTISVDLEIDGDWIAVGT